jgi:hypothetical protein
MPLQPYCDNLGTDTQDVEILRFQPFQYFEDLMANDELHFNRADLFKQDENEGLPSEGYVCELSAFALHPG